MTWHTNLHFFWRSSHYRLHLHNRELCSCIRHNLECTEPAKYRLLSLRSNLTTIIDSGRASKFGEIVINTNHSNRITCIAQAQIYKPSGHHNWASWHIWLSKIVLIKDPQFRDSIHKNRQHTAEIKLVHQLQKYQWVTHTAYNWFTKQLEHYVLIQLNTEKIVKTTYHELFI